jgi:signal peptidase I
VQALSGIESATLEGHKLELAAMLLRSGGGIRVRAFGTSMLPTIWPGDILLIQSTFPDELAPGDVVLVKGEKSILIHRLVKSNGPDWITRGDAMTHNDPAVAPADVLGRVSRIHRGNSLLPARRQIRRLQRVLGWMLCHSQICRRVALHIHSVWCDPGAHQTFAVPLDQRGSPAN